MYLFNFIHSNKFFQTLPQSFYFAQLQKKFMASSTLSAQDRIPAGDLIFFDPPLLLTLYYLGEKLSDGGKIIRRRNNYAAAEYLSRAGAGGPKVRKKLSKTVAQCRKYPIPDLNTL